MSSDHDYNGPSFNDFAVGEDFGLGLPMAGRKEQGNFRNQIAAPAAAPTPQKVVGSWDGDADAVAHGGFRANKIATSSAGGIGTIGGMTRPQAEEVLRATEILPPPQVEAPPQAPPGPPELPKTTKGKETDISRLVAARVLRAQKHDIQAESEAKVDANVGKSDPVSRAAPSGIVATASNHGIKIAAQTMKSVLQLSGVPDRITSDKSMVVAAMMKKQAAVAGNHDVEDANLYLGRTDVHPLALAMAMAFRYGEEWLSWEPETIWATIEQDMGIKVPDVVAHKLMAVKMVTNQPELVSSDWHVFEKVCVAFDGHEPRMTIIEDLEPEAMVFGCLCIHALLNGATNSRGGFQPTPDLRRYMAARLFDAGFVLPPPALAYLDPELKAMAPEGPDEELRKLVLTRYAQVLAGGDGVAPAGEPEAVTIQTARLLRCNAYAIDKADDLIRQIA